LGAFRSKASAKALYGSKRFNRLGGKKVKQESDSKHITSFFVAAVVATLFLVVVVNGIVGGPVHALSAAPKEGRAEALGAVISGASWSAFIAAASVLIAAMLGMAEGRMGAISKGINVGASAAVMAAAFFLAMTTQIS
jgi:hypothetical protein